MRKVYKGEGSYNIVIKRSEQALFVETRNGDGVSHFFHEKVDFLFFEAGEGRRETTVKEYARQSIAKGDIGFFVNEGKKGSVYIDARLEA
ncbi:MAG: hypothetical protein KGH72_00420 [Candidatus Micrarchaeota archaeon]|nr:hypothetical protein [Candidatus Micrarchaeota archaeon]